MRFQSTLPARGSDLRITIIPMIFLTFQSTLPARGSDNGNKQSVSGVTHFNPRSPRGGATHLCPYKHYKLQISIHAPREGERLHFYKHIVKPFNFNPRSPRGGATIGEIRTWSISAISIHAPREGERPGLAKIFYTPAAISIHAPREGERRKGKKQ